MQLALNTGIVKYVLVVKLSGFYKGATSVIQCEGSKIDSAVYIYEVAKVRTSMRGQDEEKQGPFPVTLM